MGSIMIKFDRYWKYVCGVSASASRRYVTRRYVTLGLVAVLPFASMVSPADTTAAAGTLATAGISTAADAATGAAATHPITPLKNARFAQDDDVKCLMSALENGNPDTGPSTFLLKAPAGCRVAPHYHSSEEQLIVIHGNVLTEMKGMSSVTLTAGGVAVMPAKAIHWFSCSGKYPCLMVVTFNQKYDIVWVDGSVVGKP
jgi:quercetin dioxygenase-like cupin family protein